MLLLKRKVGQSIIFDHRVITLRVLQVSGKQVCLGIEAPKTVKIYREEIYSKPQCDESQ